MPRLYVLIRPSALAVRDSTKKTSKKRAPKKCISPYSQNEDDTIKIEMGIEGKNFFEAQSILSRRKLLFTASAEQAASRTTAVSPPDLGLAQSGGHRNHLLAQPRGRNPYSRGTAGHSAATKKVGLRGRLHGTGPFRQENSLRGKEFESK
jgi:hypothetical protein